MKYRKILLAVCAALLCGYVGCTSAQPPEIPETTGYSETTAAAAETEPDTIMTETEPEITETEAETTEAILPDGVNIVYAAETTDYRHITYAYPIFSDNDAVNASVRLYTEKLICEQIEGAWSPEEEIPAAEIWFDLTECPAQDEDTMLSIEMDVTVTRMDDEYISLFYEGIFNVKGTPHPSSLPEGLILDAKTSEILHLSDLYTVDEAFAEFVCGYFCEHGAEQHAQKLGISAKEIPAEIFAKTPELMLEWLLYYDDPYTTTTVFLTADGLGFSFPVYHAVGDHMEIVIPYDDLKQFVKE